MTPDEAWDRYHRALEAAIVEEVYGDPDTDKDNKEAVPLWMQRVIFKWVWNLRNILQESERP